MLEIYGKGYVNELCISLFEKYQEEKSYRIYITDCLQTIAENTTHIMGMNGVVDYGRKMTMRWLDLIEPKKKKPDLNETMSCDQIVDKIWNKIERG